MMEIFDNVFDEKVIGVLNTRKPGKCVILFNHGLGDFVLFLPLFEELCKSFPQWDIYIGCLPEKNYKYLHPKCILLNAPYGRYGDIYDVIINIVYFEPPRNENELTSFNNRFGVKGIEIISKPYLCNEVEIGLKNFFWKPYKFPFKNKRTFKYVVGVHFFGHTSIAKKDTENDIAKQIWNEVIDSGNLPFEIQMVPLSILDTIETPEFINRENSLRFEYPNLRLMVDKILDCRYFIGVDSGPLYLAGSLLGFDKVIGLERLRKINKVLPVKIKKVDIEDYKENSIYNLLKEMK